MKNEKKLKIVGIVIFTFIIACMIAIFMFSSQNNTNTNDLSKKVTGKIARFIFFDYDKMSVQTKIEIISELNKFVRKLAHFTMYFMLGFCLFTGSLLFKLKNRYRFLVAMATSVVYAISDEVHQLFVSGRTAQVRDVIIDSCGTLLGVICCFALFAVAEKVLHKKIL